MGPPKTHLPVTRINTIMKSSSDVEMVGKESSLLMAKAAELFIKNLAIEAYNTTSNAKKLDYKNLAEIVHTDEKYEFLRDIMPKKITVAEVRRIMAKKQGTSDDSEKHSSSSSSDDEEDSSTDDSDGSDASA
ncbi:hypothetical protein NQ317_010933 [Molorchus minor]|uniref:Transcription factor CBF/NF-Y/archaeal histone domain-containing protein n=1 Tax=Molorchus minor TaxID=1323400 RepID=A0ABQ9J476_9CUCU|nr:hypothetical protein NQ317_010933 [Molorchus minor]